MNTEINNNLTNKQIFNILNYVSAYAVWPDYVSFNQIITLIKYVDPMAGAPAGYLQLSTEGHAFKTTHINLLWEG